MLQQQGGPHRLVEAAGRMRRRPNPRFGPWARGGTLGELCRQGVEKTSRAFVLLFFPLQGAVNSQS